MNKADLVARVARDTGLTKADVLRVLDGVLEAITRSLRRGGKVKLVKMNIDDHPAIAGQMGVQSIPAVVAFHNGQPVDGFMGAVPDSQLNEFINKLASSSGEGAQEQYHDHDTDRGAEGGSRIIALRITQQA